MTRLNNWNVILVLKFVLLWQKRFPTQLQHFLQREDTFGRPENDPKLYQLNLAHQCICFTISISFVVFQLPLLSLFQFRRTKYPINAVLSFYCAQRKYPSSVGKTLKISKLAVSSSKTQEISYWAEKHTHSMFFFYAVKS